MSCGYTAWRRGERSVPKGPRPLVLPIIRDICPIYRESIAWKLGILLYVHYETVCNSVAWRRGENPNTSFGFGNWRGNATRFVDL
jgi:hypothetical protein